MIFKIYRIFLLIILIFLICLVPVLGYATWIRNFLDINNQNVANVLVIGYVCKNSICTEVTELWNVTTWPSTPYIQPLNSNLISPSPLNQIELLFPDTPLYINNFGYLVRYFATGYKSFKNGPFLAQQGDNWGTTNLVFQKQQNCKADFQTSISSCAEQGLPLSILTDTSIDATTKTSLIPQNDYYFPVTNLFFKKWRELKTRMNVDIKKQSSSQSVLDFPSYQEHDIYAQDTYNFLFLWQTSKNTEPGTYEITMTSTVPDEKCDQTNMIPTTNTMNVYIAPSFDGCRAEIQNFRRTTTTFQINQPVDFAGQTLNVYQDWNYTSITSCQFEDAQLVGGQLFDTDYSFTITNRSNQRIIYSTSGAWPRNLDYNTPRDFILSWPSAQAGVFEADLTTTSRDLLSTCNYKGITASSRIRIDIGHDNDNDKWHDINGDCNDADYYINPSAIEICDGKDNNCNGQTDEGTACSEIAYYCDIDRDGFYSTTAQFCTGVNCVPSGCQTTRGMDCNDNNPSIRVPLTYYRDVDRDTYGSQSVFATFCPQDTPVDYVSNHLDCDDYNANVNPSRTEICNNGIDDNCNSYIDCLDSACMNIFLPCTCTITNKGIETCDGVDNDCNGEIDDILPSNTPYCYQLAEISMAPQGVCKDMKAACSSITKRFDCPFTNYETTESRCDNLDNDCDGSTDENLITMLNQKGICSDNKRICEEGKWLNDSGNVLPKTEICGNNLDDDCDGDIDETCFCNPGETKQCGLTDIGACTFGTQLCKDDKTWGSCDAIYPKTEICNDIDDDCNGKKDVEDGLSQCCFPNGKTRICISDPDCPGIQGTSSCINYQWQECKASCPQIIKPTNIIITNPEHGDIYAMCKEDEKIRVEFSPDNLVCQYRLNSKTSGNIKSGDYIKNLIISSQNTLSITCGEISKTSVFYVTKSECEQVNVPNKNNLLNHLSAELGLSEEERQNAKDTLDVIDQTIDVTYSGEDTIIKQSFTPKNELHDVDMALFIPKCLTPYLKDIDFDFSGYKIVKEDPLITWHFAKVKGRIDLSYKIKGRIPKDCLEQIKLMPIAKLIGPKLEQPSATLFSYLLPGMIIAVVATLIIYLQRFHPEEIKMSEQQYEKEFIEKQRQKLLSEIKELRFKTKQQADNNMKARGIGEEDRKWVLGKI